LLSHILHVICLFYYEINLFDKKKNIYFILTIWFAQLVSWKIYCTIYRALLLEKFTSSLYIYQRFRLSIRSYYCAKLWTLLIIENEKVTPKSCILFIYGQDVSPKSCMPCFQIRCKSWCTRTWEQLTKNSSCYYEEEETKNEKLLILHMNNRCSSRSNLTHFNQHHPEKHYT